VELGDLAIIFQDVDPWGGLRFRLFSEFEGTEFVRGEVSSPGSGGAVGIRTSYSVWIRSQFHMLLTPRPARARVYVKPCITRANMSYPLGYATVNGDLFNLLPGPVSFLLAVSMSRRGGRADRDALNTTFPKHRSRMGKAHG